MTLKQAIAELSDLAGPNSHSIGMDYWNHRTSTRREEVEWTVTITASAVSDWRQFTGATLDDAMAQARAALRTGDVTVAVEAAQAATAI